MEYYQARPASKMSRKQYDLKFDGFWREPNVGGVPGESGVYCVYVCTFDATAKTVSLQQLLYIGAAANANEAIADHHEWPNWKKYLKNDEQICVSFAPVADADRDRVAAALIYENQPPANDQFRDSFPFPPVSISTSGRSGFLTPSFDVSRTD